MTPLDVILWALAILVVIIVIAVAIAVIAGLVGSFTRRKTKETHIVGGRRD